MTLSETIGRLAFLTTPSRRIARELKLDRYERVRARELQRIRTRERDQRARARRERVELELARLGWTRTHAEWIAKV